MRTTQTQAPLARTKGLIIKEISGEILVYDQERDKAHCLNDTAALVWKYCDGHKSVDNIARLLEKQFEAPVDKKIVWYALEQLGKKDLLEEQPVTPQIMAGMNRREMVRALGVAAAVAVPLVTSILAPTPVQAATCTPPMAACSSPTTCCSGQCGPNPAIPACAATPAGQCC